jgi:hypothetical protein
MYGTKEPEDEHMKLHVVLPCINGVGSNPVEGRTKN